MLAALRIHDYNLRSPHVMRTVHTPRRRCATARFLGLRVRIPPRAWMSVSSEWCVLPGRGICVGLTTRPEKSYRVCVCVCLSVTVKSRQWRDLGPLGTVAPWEKKVTLVFHPVFKYSIKWPDGGGLLTETRSCKIDTAVPVQTQISVCPHSTTTVLYFGTATRFGSFRLSSGCQYNTAQWG